MKERECFKCGKVLDFDSYIKNVNPKERENLTEIFSFFWIYILNVTVKIQKKEKI